MLHCLYARFGMMLNHVLHQVHEMRGLGINVMSCFRNQLPLCVLPT